MSTYNIHAGHNFNCPGASGQFSETSEDRKVKNAVISKLRSLGHTVYDCTDDDAKDSSTNLAWIVNKCNAHKVDLDISIHFNAFNSSAHGVEVYTYDNSTMGVAGSICNAIAELGFYNRGPKPNPGLYVIRNTNSSAILIECCFCDSPTDAAIYKRCTAEGMAEKIVKGITGKTVSGGNNDKTNTSSNAIQTSNWKATNTATSNKDQVSVFKTAGKTKIGVVNKGNRFEVDGTKSGNYVHVKVANIGIGYIHKDYIKYDNTSSNKPVNNDSKKWIPTGTATCRVECLNVRKEPNGVIIGQLGYNNRFEVDGKKSGPWVHVKVAGIGKGYVHKDYIKYD